jgi:hypothetical protein
LKLIRIILINLVTFAILLAAINWLCGVYLKRTEKSQGRDDLPNYETDRAHAKDVFRDYYSVQHQYEPFVGWKCLPYSGKTLTIAKDGNRTHNVAEADTTKQTVRFFGGSTMWGEGSDDQHTIPALFNALRREYTVFNHAQLAYNSRQELDALISLYSKEEKADIVIFYDGVNDAAFLCPREIKQLPAHRLVPMFRDKLYVGKMAFVKDILRRIFVENILKVVHKFTYKPTLETSPYDCLSTPGKAEEIAEIMIKNWEMSNEIVTNRGGRFIAILQPAAFVGSPRTDHLVLDQELGENFKEVYRHLKRKMAERKHPWMVDLSDKFDGKDYIYIDFCHVSPNGNEIIAKEISQIVDSTQQEL